MCGGHEDSTYCSQHRIYPGKMESRYTKTTVRVSVSRRSPCLECLGVGSRTENEGGSGVSAKKAALGGYEALRLYHDAVSGLWEFDRWLYGMSCTLVVVFGYLWSRCVFVPNASLARCQSCHSKILSLCYNSYSAY
jgi:hypothetical protein